METWVGCGGTRGCGEETPGEEAPGLLLEEALGGIRKSSQKIKTMFEIKLGKTELCLPARTSSWLTTRLLRVNFGLKKRKERNFAEKR